MNQFISPADEIRQDIEVLQDKVNELVGVINVHQEVLKYTGEVLMFLCNRVQTIEQVLEAAGHDDAF